MKICGTECGICATQSAAKHELLACLLKTSLTGATFRLVPMITNRSTLSLSRNKHSSNSESRACPKNVISGCTSALDPKHLPAHLHYPWQPPTPLVHLFAFRPVPVFRLFFSLHFPSRFFHLFCYFELMIALLSAGTAPRYFRCHDIWLNILARNSILTSLNRKLSLLNRGNYSPNKMLS